MLDIVWLQAGNKRSGSMPSSSKSSSLLALGYCKMDNSAGSRDLVRSIVVLRSRQLCRSSGEGAPEQATQSPLAYSSSVTD